MFRSSTRCRAVSLWTDLGGAGESRKSSQDLPRWRGRTSKSRGSHILRPKPLLGGSGDLVSSYFHRLIGVITVVTPIRISFRALVSLLVGFWIKGYIFSGFFMVLPSFWQGPMLVPQQPLTNQGTVLHFFRRLERHLHLKPYTLNPKLG